MGIVIALLARKGGVGKTTLAANMAAVAAAEGLTVRLVDLDSQASLSQHFLGSEAVENLRPSATVEALLTGEKTAEQIERVTRINGIKLVPAHLKLHAAAGCDLELRSRTTDVTLLDLPPDVTNPIVRAALVETDFVLSPVICEPAGLESIASVQALLAGVALATNPRLTLLGYIVSMKQRLAVHNALEALLRRIHGEQVFRAAVPNLAAFKEAAVARQTVIEFASESSAAGAVRAVWSEVESRIEHLLTKRGAA